MEIKKTRTRRVNLILPLRPPKSSRIHWGVVRNLFAAADKTLSGCVVLNVVLGGTTVTDRTLLAWH